MNDLTWIEDTNARTLRSTGIRSFVAHVSPVFRFTVFGQGAEDEPTWYAGKSEGAVVRRLGYLRPMTPTTLEEAKRRCAEYQVPDM